MNKLVTLGLTAVLVLSAGAVSGRGIQSEDFEGAASADSWRVIQYGVGWEPEEPDLEWRVDSQSNSYLHTRSEEEGRHSFSISPFKITDGTIEIMAGATQANRVNRGGCFGIVVKYMDENNLCVVRFGAYGSVNIRVIEEGRPGGIRTGYHWRPVINDVYHAKVIVRGDRMMIFIDDRIIASVQDLPFAGREGFAGLYAISSASFESFAVYDE